jgi:hypothetical protein
VVLLLLLTTSFEFLISSGKKVMLTPPNHEMNLRVLTP